MIDANINDNLQRLNKYLLHLKDIRNVERDKFINDRLLIASTERFFQLAIESCLNIGNKILSIEQLSKPAKVPETYADVFQELGSIGIIDKNFALQLVKMAKFRNRLVHIYWDINPEELYNYLQNNLNDFKRFINEIVKYLNSTKN